MEIPLSSCFWKARIAGRGTQWYLHHTEFLLLEGAHCGKRSVLNLAPAAVQFAAVPHPVVALLKIGKLATGPCRRSRQKSPDIIGVPVARRRLREPVRAGLLVLSLQGMTA